jgi:hypothetical protein
VGAKHVMYEVCFIPGVFAARANLLPSCQWDVNGGPVAGIDAGSDSVISMRLLEIIFFQALVHMLCIVLRTVHFVLREQINRK